MNTEYRPYQENNGFPLNLINAGIIKMDETQGLLTEIETLSELELVNRRIIELMRE